MDYNRDICLISETHFTKESYLYLKGYKLYQAPHPSDRARGGAAILIKNTIKHHIDNVIEDEMFQAISVCVFTSLGQINIGSVYSPPKHSPKEADYEKCLRKFGGKFLLQETGIQKTPVGVSG